MDLRRLLEFPAAYRALQRLVGAQYVQTWLSLNFWKLKGTEKVVDMGCGPGDLLEAMPAGVTYVGFDINEPVVEAARARFGGRGSFITGTAGLFLQNPDNRLDDADLVLSNGLLHHLTDAEVIEGLKLAHGILKPGGRIVCLEPTFLAHQGPLSRWMMRQDRGGHVRSESEWKAIVGSVFASVSTCIVTCLYTIPYIHIIIECRKPELEPRPQPPG